MITITKEISIDDFDAWSGGKDTLNEIRDAGKLNELDSYLEEIFPNGCSDTELNDFLWFDRDSIYEALGMDDEEEEDEEEYPDSLEVEILVDKTQLDGSMYIWDLLYDALTEKIGISPNDFEFEEISTLYNTEDSIKYIATYKCTNIDWDC